jgi:hypothetical protein
VIGRAVLTIAALALFGCAAAPEDGEGMASALARVEKQCGVAPGMLTLVADGSVQVQPSPYEKYERVDCVLNELRKPEFADHVKLGFVGNEAYAKEEKE